MGGKSKSNSSTTNNNVSGQTGIDGDNLGVALSGINNSPVNITATDHGAVQGGFNIAEQALLMGGEMMAGVAGAMGEASSQAMGVASQGLDLAGELSERSMSFASDGMAQAFGLAGEMVSSNQAFANQVLAGNAQLADRAMNNNAVFANQVLAGNAQLSERAMLNTNAFAIESLKNNALLADRMVDRYADDVGANRQLMAGLAGNQAAQNSENLNTLMDLAKHKQDGGASVQSKQQLIAFVAIIAVVGFAFVRAAK